MWYPINNSALCMGSATPMERCPTHPDNIILNERLDAIKEVLKDDFNSLSTLLPEQPMPWGKISTKDGHEVIYSVSADSDNKPCFCYALHHRMTDSSFVYILSDGESDAFDFDDSDASLVRLNGIADNWEYEYEDKTPKEFHLFWKTKSPFSQWHECRFRALGLQFCSAEQYMMFMKAYIHKDYETAEQIMAIDNPRKQKELGRKVKNFNDKLWFANCRRVVYEANKYKFTQNLHLLNELLATDSKSLVEASPYDTIWGIGLSADDSRALDKEQWQGKNWLGETLTLLRDDLKYCIENSPEWVAEDIEDKPLNEWQYNSLVKSYHPDWDCRYSPCKLGDYHYITRNGVWVKKFKYEKQTDDLYHITEHYTTTVEQKRDLLEEIFIDGYFQPYIGSPRINDKQKELLSSAYELYGDFNVTYSYLKYKERFDNTHYVFEVCYEPNEEGTFPCVGEPQFILVSEGGEAHWATEREREEIIFVQKAH